MEESQKKALMVGIIVLCLVLAGLISYKTRKPDRYDFSKFKDEMTWVTCRNPDCYAEYQISLQEYFEYVEENQDPGLGVVPALICKKCGKDSVYEAVKCPKCQVVFEKGLKRGDYRDRCPKCGFSQTEEDRHTAAGG